MTRNSPRRKVGADFWSGRLRQGRDFLEAARQALELADQGQNANPIVSQIVLSAIAYADCLTARRAGVVNTQDHAAAPNSCGCAALTAARYARASFQAHSGQER